MATATPNILINSISGRIGNVVFYTRRRAGGAITQCVRLHVIPRNPDTEAQREVRRSFGEAVRSWQSLSADEKHEYIRKARYLNMSGYNLFISKYLKRVMQAVNHTPIDELNSKNSPLTWNPELPTLNFLPIPSVSASYINRSGIKTHPGALKYSPG